jgi:hypothetical protein
MAFQSPTEDRINMHYSVLVNVFPKAGTHLLLNLVNALPGYQYKGRDIDMGDPLRAVRVISEMGPGDVVKSHLPWRPELQRVISNNGVLMLSLIRDPRDIVVSLVHYLMKHRQHPLHDAYASLGDFNERLYRTITGFEYRGERVCRDIGSRLADWEPWLDRKAQILRFEDLVGIRGGGDEDRQRKQIIKTMNYLKIDHGITDPSAIQAQIFDPSAHSFRRGRCGGWREVFDERHKAAFQDCANWALLKYGYETNAHW